MTFVFHIINILIFIIMMKFFTNWNYHSFSPQALRLWLCLLLFAGSAGAFAQNYVAQIGDEKYTSLQNAFYDAGDGSVVELLSDVDATDEVYEDYTRACLGIIHSITLDGKGYTLTVDRQGLYVCPQAANARANRAPADPSTFNFNVTIKDITIKNVAKQEKGYGGRCLITGGQLGSLTLDGVTLTTNGSAYNSTLQPLVIGGNQATAPTVTVKGGSIIADANGAKGNAITSFNPVVLYIEDGAALTGSNAIRFLAADNSAGASGSTVTIDGSTLTAGSQGAVLYFEDGNIKVDVTSSTINAADAAYLAQINSKSDVVVTLGADNTVDDTNAQLTDTENGTSFSVAGSKFKKVVAEEFLAEGQIAHKVKNADGYFIVETGTYACYTGGTDRVYYPTLDEALNEANTFNASFGEGGWSTVRVPYANCADGYYCPETTTTDGKYMMAAGTYAAKAGDYGYETLQAALNVGGEVTVLKDITLDNTATVASGKTVTLDLNGYKVTSANSAIWNYGTLTIMDNSTGATGSVTSTGSWAVGAFVNSATTISNGTFNGGEGAVCTYNKTTNATIIINGGTFNAEDNAVLSDNGTSGASGNTFKITAGTFNGKIKTAGYVACGIYAANDDTWNISGGTFNITGGAGVVQRAGTVNISGNATFIVTGNATGKVGDSRVVVPCAALVFDSQANYPGLQSNQDSKLAVTGGTFTAEGDAVAYVANEGAATHIAISGGSFSSQVPMACCAEGYISPETPVEGMYTVKQGEYEAAIGDYGYETLQAALNVGGEVKVLMDITLGNTATVASGKTVTLDLNGHKITNTAANYAVVVEGKLTVNGKAENSAIDCGTSKRVFLVKGGDLTINSGSFTGNYAVFVGNGVGGNETAVTVDNSKVVINGGKFNAQEMCVATRETKKSQITIHDGTFTSVDNAVISDNGTKGWTGNTFTITGGTFNGGITTAGYVACGIYAANDDTWNISGGTFNITGGAGVVQRAGTVNISGNATFIVTGNATGKVGDSRVVVPCAALVFDSQANYPGLQSNQDSKLAVTGGTFTAEGDAVAYVANEGAATHIAIAGGSFSSAVPENCCAENYIPKDNSDNTYGVKTGAYVAHVGTQGYEEFADALTALTAGATLSLDADVALAADYESTINFTLTFNGKDLTLDDKQFKLDEGVVITTDVQKADFFTASSSNYMVVEEAGNGVYTYTAKTKESQGIFEFNYDSATCPYALDQNVENATVTYTRSFGEDRVNKYQGWVAPFDYTITSDDADAFRFFKINMIANSSDQTEVANSEKIWIFVDEMEADDILHANKPYLLKAKAAVTNYEFKATDVTVYKKPTESIHHVETSLHEYSFYAAYDKVQASESDPLYYMNTTGQIAKGTTVTIPAYRWYMKVTSKGGSYVPGIEIIVNGEEATGVQNVVDVESDKATYYTLDGVRVDTPSKGIYIKRSANGQTKKVSFK